MSKFKQNDVVRLTGLKSTQVATVERTGEGGKVVLTGALGGVTVHHEDRLELASGAPDKARFTDRMQAQVLEFHEAFDIVVSKTPQIPSQEVAALRIALIGEEFQEFTDASIGGDVVEAADAIVDLLYVVFGAAVSFGIDVAPLWDEVHRSNMSKVGGHKAPNGKWIKPETYSPANLAPLLEAQGWKPEPDEDEAV